MQRIRESRVAQIAGTAIPVLVIIVVIGALVFAAVRRAALERDAANLGSNWDPRRSLPPIEAGVLDFPVFIAVVPFAAFALGDLIRRLRLKRRSEDLVAIEPTPSVGGRSVWPRVAWLAYWIPFSFLFLIGPFRGGHDPFVSGSTVAPGPMVSEIREDGSWLDEALDDQTTIVQGPHDPCDGPICAGPRYIAPVGPGEVVTYLVTIRNTSPFGLTILGPVGELRLGLPRNPDRPSADPADAVPFHPVTLAAGAEMAVVVGRIATACADPAAKVPVHVGDRTAAFGFGIVYDIFGWWREAAIYPPVEVTIPGEANCNAPGTSVPA